MQIPRNHGDVYDPPRSTDLAEGADVHEAQDKVEPNGASAPIQPTRLCSVPKFVAVLKFGISKFDVVVVW